MSTVRSSRFLRRILVALCIFGFVGCGAAQREAQKRNKKAGFHHKLAAGYFHSKNIDLAIRELMKGLAFEPEHSKSRYLLGFILFGRKRYEEAISNFKRSLASNKGFFAARNHLGVTYLALERWQDAIDTLKPLLKEPTYTTPYHPYNNIGWAYLKLRRLDLAEKHLRMAVFINPKFCQGHRNLGLLAEKRADQPGAQQHFQEAVRRCPKIPSFHFSLGNLYCRSRQPDLALKAYKVCTERAGASALGRRCRARVELVGEGGCR